MADINGKRISSPYSSPTIHYDITYTKSRISNSQMRYNFTIKTSLNSTGSYFYSFNSLQCTITVNGTSGSVELKDRNSNWSGIGPHSTKTLSITCTSTKANEIQTVRFRVNNPNTSSSEWNAGEIDNSSYTVTSSPLLYTACSPPTNVRLNVSIAAPGYPTNHSGVTLMWSPGKSGTNNTLQSYYVQQRIGTTGQWTDATRNGSRPVNPGANATSIGLDLPSSARGQQIYFRIRAEGSAGSSYYSSYVTTSVPVTVNTLPVITNYKANANKISKNGKDGVYFSWNISDPQYYAQVLTTIYSSNIGGISDTTTLENKYIDIPAGNGADKFILTLKARDDAETNPTEYKIEVKYNKPSTMQTLTTTAVDGSRVANILLNYTADNPDSDTLRYYIQGAQADTLEGLNSASYRDIVSTLSTSYTDDMSWATAGNYVKYRVRVNDGYDYSDYLELTTIVRKNRPIPLPSADTFKCFYPYVYNETTYELSMFENSITLEWQNSFDQSLLLPGQSLSQVRIERGTSNSSSGSFTNWSSIGTFNSSTNTNIDTGQVLANLTRDWYVKYRIYYIDDMGLESSYLESNSMRKNRAPSLTGVVNFTGLSFDFAYHPYTDLDGLLNITWNWGSDDMPNIGDGGPSDAPHTFEIAFYLPSTNQTTIISTATNSTDGEITWQEGSSTNSYNIITSTRANNTVTLADWINTAFASTTKNDIYEYCEIRITAIDIFGVRSNTIYNTFTMVLSEAPYFDETVYNELNSEMYLGKAENFIISKVIEYEGLSVPLEIPLTNDSKDNYQMVNSGEKIKFKWPVAKDYNGDQDISYYYIYSYYKENDGEILNTEDYSKYNQLRMIDYRNDENFSETNGICSYTIPQTSIIDINRVVKFFIYATDSRGNISRRIKFPYGLELCRHTTPSITLENARFSSSGSDTSELALEYMVTHYGGSNLSNARSPLEYPNRRNLEEINTRDNRNITIAVEVGESLDSFSDYDTNFYSISGIEYPWNEELNIAIPSNELITSSDSSIALNVHQNWYIRLRITVNYESGSRTSFSNIILLRNISAPYSFRKIGLGINQGDPEGKLHVSPRINTSNNEDRAIFGGEDNTKRLIIDLTNGRIISGWIDGGDIDTVFENI